MLTACTEQYSSYTVSSADDEWEVRHRVNRIEVEIATWQAEEKKDTKYRQR